MINTNNYVPVTTPCTIHYIGGKRYMLDTEHTFTQIAYPDMFIDDVTGQIYFADDFYNGDFNRPIILEL